MLKNLPWPTLLRRALLTLAVLTSAAAVVVLGFAVYLVAEGYSAGSDPQNYGWVGFTLAYLVMIFIGAPVALACAGSWIGYQTAVRKSRQLPQ